MYNTPKIRRPTVYSPLNTHCTGQVTQRIYDVKIIVNNPHTKTRRNFRKANKYNHLSEAYVDPIRFNLVYPVKRPPLPLIIDQETYSKK